MIGFHAAALALLAISSLGQSAPVGPSNVSLMHLKRILSELESYHRTTERPPMDIHDINRVPQELDFNDHHALLFIAEELPVLHSLVEAYERNTGLDRTCRLRSCPDNLIFSYTSRRDTDLLLHKVHDMEALGDSKNVIEELIRTGGVAPGSEQLFKQVYSNFQQRHPESQPGKTSPAQLEVLFNLERTTGFFARYTKDGLRDLWNVNGDLLSNCQGDVNCKQFFNDFIELLNFNGIEVSPETEMVPETSIQEPNEPEPTPEVSKEVLAQEQPTEAVTEQQTTEAPGQQPIQTSQQ